MRDQLPMLLLPTVLFPGSSLQLEIAEPRAQRLMRRSARLDTPFGVALMRPKGVSKAGLAHSVGTMARLLHFDEEGKDDASIRVRVVGVRRLGVAELQWPNEGCIAQVEELPPLDSAVLSAAQQGLRRLYTEYQQLLRPYGAAGGSASVLPFDPVAAAWRMAAGLRQNRRWRQHLLESSSAEILTERLSRMLQGEIGRLSRLATPMHR